MKGQRRAVLVRGGARRRLGREGKDLVGRDVVRRRNLRWVCMPLDFDENVVFNGLVCPVQSYLDLKVKS